MATARNPFPSIPTPTKTVEGLHATVAALHQAVSLLVSNAQGAGQQTLPQNAYVFAQSDQVTQASNAAGFVNTKTVSLQTQVNTLTVDINALESEVTALQTSINGAIIQAGTVESGAIAPGAVSARAQDIESAITTATANIILAATGDVLVFVAYLGSATGVGAILAVAVDGGAPIDIIKTTAIGGVAQPGVGFLLVPELAAGAHTFVVTATVGGTPENNVQIAVVGLVR